MPLNIAQMVIIILSQICQQYLLSLETGSFATMSYLLCYMSHATTVQKKVCVYAKYQKFYHYPELSDVMH